MLPAGSSILAIDQGTHASRALLFDVAGRIVASGERELALVRPQPDWAEQDGESIVASVHAAIATALRNESAPAGRIAAAGIASQRASAVCWDRVSGRTLSPVFSWQDRRAHAWIAALEREHGEAVHRSTGLFLSPHYGASKLRWALDNLPAVRAAATGGTLAWGPLASFLAFRLTAGRAFVADPQCAARTQLWDLHARNWRAELLTLFGLPAGFLPASTPTCHAFGTLASGTLRVPLRALNGDQSAAVFAFGWPRNDTAYVNIGTSAFVQRVLDRDPGHSPRQLTGIILDDGTRTLYTVEGNVNGAGSALEWFGHEERIPDLLERLPAWLAAPCTPPLFLNGIAGLGGPFWRAQFDSRYVGDGTLAERAVALVESIAFLLQANVDEMRKRLPPARRMLASGGVSRLDGLCRILASLSDLPVVRRDDPEASARGIAYLAAGMPEAWDAGVREEVFAPRPDAALAGRYARWREIMRESTGI